RGVDVDAVLAGLYELVAPHLTEKQRRLLAGAAARALGRGVAHGWPASPGCPGRRCTPACGSWMTRLTRAGASAGRAAGPAGWPAGVTVHDVPGGAAGEAIPYGVYDLGSGAGWVSVGTDHDTAAFAVATIRRWWEQTGRVLYPKATRLLATADAGAATATG